MSAARIQPQGRVRLSLGNSIARKLKFAFVPGVGDAAQQLKSLNSYTTGASRFGKSTLALSAAPFPEFGTLDVRACSH
jgi:hypothetical protein